MSQSPEDRQTIETVLIKALFPHTTSHFSPIIPRHDDETFPLITSMGQVITTIRHIQIDIYYQNKMQMSLRVKNLVSKPLCTLMTEKKMLTLTQNVCVFVPCSSSGTNNAPRNNGRLVVIATSK